MENLVILNTAYDLIGVAIVVAIDRTSSYTVLSN